MFNKLKQFKDLRSQAKVLQQKLSDESVTVKTMGDNISMTVDGNLEIKDLNINPDFLNPDKKEKIEQGIKDAHKEALKKMQRVVAGKMKEMGGFPSIPGLTS